MSNNLGRTTVAAAQGSNVFTAINDADEVMDKAMTGVFDLLVDGVAATISAADWKNQTIRVGDDSPGATGGVTVTVPATVRGVVTIVNNLAYSVTITISGQSAPAPVILAGGTGLLSSDGVNVRAAAAAAGGSYDIPMNFAGTPTANEVVSAYMLVRDVDWEANFAGSTGRAVNPPTSSFVVSVRIDGTEIGTITYGNDSPVGDATFATDGGTSKSAAAGALLEFVAPSVPDASISYILATLKGTG